eukprot:s406_g4.t1
MHCTAWLTCKRVQRLRNAKRVEPDNAMAEIVFFEFQPVFESNVSNVNDFFMLEIHQIIAAPCASSNITTQCDCDQPPLEKNGKMSFVVQLHGKPKRQPVFRSQPKKTLFDFLCHANICLCK